MPLTTAETPNGHEDTTSRSPKVQMLLRVVVPSWLTLMVMVGAAAVLPASFDTSYSAWQRGDYAAALNGFIQILGGPGGDADLERIALTTGELFQTTELTSDGRNGRFSWDGRFVLYESGLEVSRRTLVLANDDSRRLLFEVPGISATVNRDGSKIAYLRVNQTPDVKRASDALDAAALTAQNRTLLIQTLAWTIARDSTIVVREVATGRELELPTPPLVKTALTYSADGRSLLFLAAKEGNDSRTDIYTIAEGSAGPVLAVEADGLKSAPIVDASGAVLVYVVPQQTPLRRPTDAPPAGPPRPPTSFAIVDVASKRATIVTGTAPALSADGKTLAYVTRDGVEFRLMVGPATGMQTALLRTAQRIDAPALSPDGRRVAWQMMPRDDWEIFLADVDGSVLKGERLTREIQHDVLPRFLDANHLIGLVGEPRHRRSYLYTWNTDGSGVSRTRLFHNNTVRTIAPEYQWAASPEGTRLVVGAERDGDTVSPQRGVYVMDLTRKVAKADLISRLKANLKAETALKTAAARTFQPLAEEIRGVVSRVSVERIFGYEKALFDFDSKHVTRPGNRKAAEFLHDAYASFGYQPEYQWFEPSRAPRAGGAGSTANVVATLRGTVNPELVYVVSSHYDSVADGPGADDDSSGTAALLEAARVLAGHPLPATVIFASMTGEEAGLLGSREFVRRAVEAKMQVAGVLNNDMIGWMNDERMDNTIRYSNPGIRDIQHGAAMLFTKLITYDALYWKGTDAMSFYDVYGDVIGGIGSYPVLGSPYYHQPSDLLENESHQLIAETSKTTVATIMLLASSPSRLTNLKVDSYNGTAASLSWTPSPERNVKGVTSYIVTYGPPASPSAHRLSVTAPHTTLPQVPPGTIVSVKAVNARGLEGWDWARITIADAKQHSTAQ